MKNTNLAFCALAGISSMPATLTAGQAHPEERPADQAATECNPDRRR